MRKISVSELLNAYAQGKRDFREVDLSCANLFECNLQDIDLRGSDLSYAYLPYTNLSRANLEDTLLKNAELSNIRLQSAVLIRANCQQIDLSYANLCNCKLRKAVLTHANLQQADIRFADLSFVDQGANLSSANLDQAILKVTNVAGSNFYQAQGVNLSDATVDQTTIFPNGHHS